jgi:hypothetical protein
LSSYQQGGYFEASADSGERILGWCSWGDPARGAQVPTAEQIRTALDADGTTLASGESTCHLTNFPVADNLNAMAVFSGVLFRDLIAIHASLVHLIADFEGGAH